MSKQTLESLVDQVLAEVLSPGVKAAVDRALAAGMSKTAILAEVRRQCGGRKGQALSVESYLGCDQDGDPK